MSNIKENPKKQNDDIFKVVKDNDFVYSVLKDVTAINLTEQERNKLSVYLRYESGNGSLFNSIDNIYKIIGANFNEPGKFLIVPFLKNGKEHINIQAIR